ncbi:MAG: acyl-CoA thioesterase [Frankiales bacterium]|nr:acyl-CoA thioesterase [Frankiales bacterium]
MATAPIEPAAPPFGADTGRTILDAIELEEIDRDLYRTCFVRPHPFGLFGGLVASQALHAAGLTVPGGRLPHSMHGYFLRAGDPDVPTVMRVERDRDGNSFSARRTIALQGGKVIFNLSASFQTPHPGEEVTRQEAPLAAAPETLPLFTPPYLFGFEGRSVVVPEGIDPRLAVLLPTRIWLRSNVALPDDPLIHACALTYLSDSSSGNGPLTTPDAAPGPSIDHAVWFHRHVRLDEWVLMDMQPHTAAQGRAWYTGAFYGGDGLLAANLAQEALLRTGPSRARTAPDPRHV